MKPFTIAEYQKDPSKLSSNLYPAEKLPVRHELISNDRLLVEWGGGPRIYTEKEAAERFVLRTQYRELRIRPWRFQCGTEIFTSTPPTMSSAWRWVGPEQTILIED